MNPGYDKIQTAYCRNNLVYMAIILLILNLARNQLDCGLDKIAGSGCNPGLPWFAAAWVRLILCLFRHVKIFLVCG